MLSVEKYSLLDDAITQAKEMGTIDDIIEPFGISEQELLEFLEELREYWDDEAMGNEY